MGKLTKEHTAVTGRIDLAEGPHRQAQHILAMVRGPVRGKEDQLTRGKFGPVLEIVERRQ